MLDKAVMRLSGIHKVLGLLAGLDFLQAIFIIGQAYFLSSTITGLWHGHGLRGQLKAMIFFMLAYFGRHAINYIKDKQLDAFSEKHSKALRSQLLSKIFRLGPAIVQEEGSGNVITMALDGISLVENYLHLVLNKMMNMSVIPMLILLFIFYLDWESGLILLLVFPLIIIFMVILGLAAKSKADRQYASYQLLSNHFLDSLRGIDTLRFFGISKVYAKSIYNSSESFRKATMSALKVGILSTFALDFFTTLSVAIVAVLLGLRLINEDIFLFKALTILILAPEYFIPVRDFSSDYHATLDGKNAFQAVQKILAKEESAVEDIKIATWTEKSRIALNDVALDYDETPFLEIPQVHFSGYHKIGIVGMSGSGKSTLVNLLSGFLEPSHGHFMVDDQVTSSMNQTDWRKQLLYIPQSPYVFEMTLRDNIAFYTPKASEKEILEAVKVVGLEGLLAELPQGLDTIVGNGARPLSGGQAQRIALARAFLDQSRKILLLDEPTAHLDIETEVELKERMLPLMENRLVFFATHRLHWLKEMDTILVLENGRLVEVGSYNELMAKKASLFHLKHAMGGLND